MGLFTYHRLGKIKSAQRDTAREIRQGELDREKLENSKEFKEIKSNIYLYLSKNDFKNINIHTIKKIFRLPVLQISATTNPSKSKNEYIKICQHIIGELYKLPDDYMKTRIVFYNNLNKFLIYDNDNNNIIFGSNKIQKIHQEHVKEMKNKRNHNKKLNKKILHTLFHVLEYVISIICIIFLAIFTFIFYLIVIFNKNLSNKSIWTRKQQIIILIITGILSFFLILGSVV